MILFEDIVDTIEPDEQESSSVQVSSTNDENEPLVGTFADPDIIEKYKYYMEVIVRLREPQWPRRDDDIYNLREVAKIVVSAVERTDIIIGECYVTPPFLSDPNKHGNAQFYTDPLPEDLNAYDYCDGKTSLTYPELKFRIFFNGFEKYDYYVFMDRWKMFIDSIGHRLQHLPFIDRRIGSGEINFYENFTDKHINYGSVYVDGTSISLYHNIDYIYSYFFGKEGVPYSMKERDLYGLKMIDSIDPDKLGIMAEKRISEMNLPFKLTYEGYEK